VDGPLRLLRADRAVWLPEHARSDAPTRWAVAMMRVMMLPGYDLHDPNLPVAAGLVNHSIAGGDCR
jgi:hypothetical protein